MRRIVIPGTSLEVSRIGFGTAALHHLATGRQRESLLAQALDTGFTHFDTARMYGEGMAERTLGQFASAGRRSRITIATKVGFPARRLAERIPQWMYVEKLTTVASRRLGFQYRPRRPRSLTESAAQSSFAKSLRALRTDFVDILFVHEPSSEELPLLSALADWLDRQRRAGRARHVGLAGNPAECAMIATALPGVFDILQVEDSLAMREADAVTQAGRPLQMSFGYFRTAAVSGSGDADTTRVMTAALARNPHGMILASTRRPARIPVLAAATESEAIR